MVLSRELQVSYPNFTDQLKTSEHQTVLLTKMHFVFVKGMVEVVAENYHNIWAKKKKSDLGSRGGFPTKL